MGRSSLSRKRKQQRKRLKSETCNNNNLDELNRQMTFFTESLLYFYLFQVGALFKIVGLVLLLAMNGTVLSFNFIIKQIVVLQVVVYSSPLKLFRFIKSVLINSTQSPLEDRVQKLETQVKTLLQLQRSLELKLKQQHNQSRSIESLNSTSENVSSSSSSPTKTTFVPPPPPPPPLFGPPPPAGPPSLPPLHHLKSRVAQLKSDSSSSSSVPKISTPKPESKRGPVITLADISNIRLKKTTLDPSSLSKDKQATNNNFAPGSNSTSNSTSKTPVTLRRAGVHRSPGGTPIKTRVLSPERRKDMSPADVFSDILKKKFSKATSKRSPTSQDTTSTSIVKLNKTNIYLR